MTKDFQNSIFILFLLLTNSCKNHIDRFYLDAKNLTKDEHIWLVYVKTILDNEMKCELFKYVISDVDNSVDLDGISKILILDPEEFNKKILSLEKEINKKGYLSHASAVAITYADNKDDTIESDIIYRRRSNPDISFVYTILHEMGHAWRLEHSEDRNDIMYHIERSELPPDFIKNFSTQLKSNGIKCEALQDENDI